jgi:hypothetical protein
MDTELITATDQPQLPSSPVGHVDRVASILQSAIESGVSVDTLGKLVELQERVMAKQAEQEFNAALLAFQAECPIINKNKTADTGKYTYEYADLSHLVASIRPLLTKHGLSFSFDSGIADGKVSVTCIVAHIGGHKVPTKFTAPTDAKSAMNDTQKVASAVSYCQRYALRLALGLTVGEDDDGRRAYENPTRNPNAPKAEPRAKRQAKEPLPNECDKHDIAHVFAEWLSQNPDPNGDRDAARAKFQQWVEIIVGRAFPTREIAAWKYREVEECCKRLGCPTYREVQEDAKR